MKVVRGGRTIFSPADRYFRQPESEKPPVLRKRNDRAAFGSVFEAVTRAGVKGAAPLTGQNQRDHLRAFRPFSNVWGRVE